MTRLILIRHGETEWNAAGRFQGWADIPLSGLGLAQARALGRRFARGELQADLVVASPLQRAIQTAQPVAEAVGAPFFVDERFKEINYGKWDGLTFRELKTTYGEEFLAFIREPHKNPFPGDGCLQNVLDRVTEGLADLLCPENAGKNLVVVSHAGIVRLSIFSLLGWNPGLFNSLGLDNTGVSVVELWDNGRRVLRTLNDHSHLAEV